MESYYQLVYYLIITLIISIASGFIGGVLGYRYESAQQSIADNRMIERLSKQNR
jgi:hypothetical protein